MKDFINDASINDILEQNRKPETFKALEIIQKAKEMKGLSLDETAVLLQCEDRDVISGIMETARFVKREIYGNRLGTFRAAVHIELLF